MPQDLLGVRRGLSTKEIGSVKNIDNGLVKLTVDLTTFSRDALEFRGALLFILKSLVDRKGRNILCIDSF